LCGSDLGPAGPTERVGHKLSATGSSPLIFVAEFRWVEACIPDVRPHDEAARRFGRREAALEEAGLRAGDIPLGGSLVGMGAYALGVPEAAGLGGAFALGRTLPQIPLAVGSVPVRGTAAAARAAALPAVRGSALGARVLDNAEDAVDPLVAELLRRALAEGIRR
jgi:hypothetical protein